MRQAHAEQTATMVVPPRWAYPLVTIVGLLLGAQAIVRGTRAIATAADSDLTNFFFKSATYILHGDALHMYAVRAGDYPNYNPPLSIFLMAPLLGLAHLLHFDANYGERITFVSLPFLLFVPLLGYLILRALRQLYPAISATQSLLAYMLIVLSPLTWQTYGAWYHIEQPMMLCALVASLLALRARREALGGLLAGLALMSRTTALFPLLAIGVLLLLAREWRAIAKYFGVMAAVALIIMAPFYLADRPDVTYAFLTWRGGATIGGNSIWSLFASSSTSGLRHTLDTLARHLDAPSVLLFVTITAVYAAYRLRITASSRDAWAVVAVAAIAVPMLSKTNWPYYYLEPFIPLLIWEFTSLHDRLAGVWRWPVLSFGYLLVAGALSQYIGLRSVGALDRISVGLLEFATMLAFAAAVWLRLRAAKPAAAAAVSPSAPLAIPSDPRRAALAPSPAASPSSASSSAPYPTTYPAQPYSQQPYPPASSNQSPYTQQSAPTSSGALPAQPSPQSPHHLAAPTNQGWALSGMQSGPIGPIGPGGRPQRPAPAQPQRPGAPSQTPPTPGSHPQSLSSQQSQQPPQSPYSAWGDTPAAPDQWPDLDAGWRPPAPRP